MKKLCLSILLGWILFLPMTVQGVEVTWQADDFVYEGETLYGFSKKGIEKLSTSGDLILPQTTEEGEKLSRVGSFAFVYNKKTAISDYTAREDENGEISSLDVDGNPIKDLGEEFNANQLTSVTIPDGYQYVGSDAFSDNKNLTRITLPQSLKKVSDYSFAHASLESVQLPDSLSYIGNQAFFDNRIQGTLSLPTQLEFLGERSFKSNLISDVVFSGQKLKTISEAAFQDNQLKTVQLPRSVERIEEGAFSANIGEDRYGNRVILRTSDGTNPHQLAGDSFYLNPGEELQNELLDIDVSKWIEEDFTFDSGRITGFSEQGLVKVKKNKALVLPSHYKGQVVTEIGADAFRNIDFESSSLKKYDLESVQLPATIRKIGSFAFQSNNLEEVEMNEDLLEIGSGAFMNNRIKSLSLNDHLKIIGDAAFHINYLSVIVIPENVERIGRSAFRQNTAENLIILSQNLTEIEEMAFLGNQLSELDLSLNSRLKTIGMQAFAANRLMSVTLPDSLTGIESEAFKTNRLTQIALPDSVTSLYFDAFDDNPGQKSRENKVLVTTNHQNVNHLADGTNFMVDPDQLASHLQDLENVLRELDGIDFGTLQDQTRQHFERMRLKGQEMLLSPSLREAEKLKYIHDTYFFIGRASLDSKIKESIMALSQAPKTNLTQAFQWKVEEAKEAYRNAALSDKRIQLIEKDLALFIDLTLGRGEISQARMVQGVYYLDSPQPVPAYYIGVNLYVDKTGKILGVVDMSRTIGQGQTNEYGSPIVNVDEDNDGYHRLASTTLTDYVGLSIDEIISHTVDSIGNIRLVEKAPYHREGFYEAIKDAAKEAKKGEELPSFDSSDFSHPVISHERVDWFDDSQPIKNNSELSFVTRVGSSYKKDQSNLADILNQTSEVKKVKEQDGLQEDSSQSVLSVSSTKKWTAGVRTSAKILPRTASKRNDLIYICGLIGFLSLIVVVKKNREIK